MLGFDTFMGRKRPVRSDEEFMQEALIAAERAKANGDRPVGAMLVMSSDKSLVEHDTSLTDGSPLNTATINVLRKAYDLMPRRVVNSVLYCTVEPNALNVTAAHECGITEIVFGCYNLKDGWISCKNTVPGVDEWITYKCGVLAEECFNVLTDEMKEYCSIDDRSV